MPFQRRIGRVAPRRMNNAASPGVITAGGGRSKYFGRPPRRIVCLFADFRECGTRKPARAQSAYSDGWRLGHMTGLPRGIAAAAHQPVVCGASRVHRGCCRCTRRSSADAGHLIDGFRESRRDARRLSHRREWPTRYRE